MPSLSECIINAQRQGAISAEDAADLMRRYNAFLAAFRQTMGEGQAAAQAKAMLAERLDKEGLQRKRAALLQLETNEINRERLLNNKNARGEADPAEALTYMLEYFGELEAGGGTSVAGRQKALVGLAHSQMEAVLEAFQRGLSGRRLNKARLENVVREAFGEDTGDEAAKALARAWSATAEDLRQRYNQHGGTIGELENWGLPQRHDGRAVRAAGYAVWRGDLMKTLDVARMRDHLTGRPLTPEQLEETLRHVFDTITTEGWAHRDPSMAAGGKGALFEQHAESRFLVFKNADAWLAYQKAYGEGDPFAAMMGHVNVMARDIAAMQVFGPNPEAGFEYAKQIVTQQAQLARAGQAAVFPTRTEIFGRRIKDPVDYARRHRHEADRMWSYLRGATNAPVATTLADVAATARNLVSASALGSAVLSAPSDLGFQALARRFAGLPLRGMLGEIVRNFSGASQREMTRAALILDSAAHTMGEQARLTGLQSGRAWSAVLQDRVMAAQGLSALTQAGKQAFGGILMGTFADHAHLHFDRLPAALQRTLRRYGIDAPLWQVISAAELHDLQAGSGATILRPADVAAIDPALLYGMQVQNVEVFARPELSRALPATALDDPEVRMRALARTAAERYLEMILAETEYAVPSGTVRARTWMIGDNQGGTLPGELLRSAAQFKSFGASVWQLQVGRIAREMAGKGIAAGAGYATALLVATTMLGALSMQLKSLSKGQDPRPMDDPKFWGAAVMQGGGLGIFGDFFLADVNRMGGSFQSTLAGPLIGRLDNVWKLTAGNFVQYAAHDKTNFGRELTTFIRQNMPGSSLWYLRLAWERVAMDRLQQLIDPEAHAAFRRRRNQTIRDQRTDYWWSPGASAPERAVDWANAWRGAP